MSEHEKRSGNIEELKALLGRLAASGLSLGEASLVRSKVLQLIGQSNADDPPGSEAGVAAASSPVTDVDHEGGQTFKPAAPACLGRLRHVLCLLPIAC